MRLTTRSVEAMQPSSERREIPDGYLPGLYLVVQPSGAKSWAIRYRHHSRPRKYTLGGFPVLDLKAARELGAKALRAVAEGRDPGQEKAQQPDSIESVAEQFIERHVRRLNRPLTIQATERALRQHVLPRWRGRTVDSITRRDILDVLDRVVDNGMPVMANRVLAAVRKMFSWAASRDIIAVSPCAGVKPPTVEKPRDRVLDDDELRKVWQAADKIGWPFGPLVQLLALTGQRRDEVGRMQWSEINLDKRLSTLPAVRVKTGKAHEVPLSAAAIGILKSLPRSGDLVLTTNGATAASGYSKAKRRIDAMCPIPPWRLHDLRRTVASGMAKLNINLPVIEKVLNHSSGSFAGIVGRLPETHIRRGKTQGTRSVGRFCFRFGERKT